MTDPAVRMKKVIVDGELQVRRFFTPKA